MNVTVPLTVLKNALPLTGNFNQTINYLRRNFIKPSLPTQCARLIGITDGSSKRLP